MLPVSTEPFFTVKVPLFLKYVANVTFELSITTLPFGTALINFVAVVTTLSLIFTLNVGFDAGKTSCKLYFMMGLPTETYEDLDGIADLAKAVIEAYYENPNIPARKRPKNYRIPSDVERMAMNGTLSDDAVKLERKRLNLKLAEAEDMIRQRKEEGYQFDKVAAIARREFNRELAHEEGRIIVGKEGIRFWQSLRKDTLQKLKELELAEKIQKRYDYTNKIVNKK